MKKKEPTATKKLLHDRGICVIIPTYNNSGTLGRVVSDVLQYCADVIVVNDGSTDGTAAVLSGMNVVAIGYERNRGKGYALKTGFKKALEMGFVYAITLDADGQHYAKDIPSFLEANIKCPGSFIVGSRNLDGVKRSRESAFANKFSNFWFCVQTGRRLKDSQSGYRLYPLKKLRGLSLLTNRYEAELELMVFASWHGVKIHSVPIDVHYPPLDERVSHFRPVADFTRIFLLNTVLCVLALVYGLPLFLWRILMTGLRSLLTGFVFVVLSVFVVTPYAKIYIKIHGEGEETTKHIHKLLYKVANLLIAKIGLPGVKFRRKVKDFSVFDTPRVIICNHQSNFDSISQLTLSTKIIFLTNDWVRNSPFFGFLIRSAEFLPMSAGVDSLLPKLQELVRRGYSIGMYPEGTRSKDDNIDRFHVGAFYLAEKLGLGVLPMFFYGAGKVLRRETYHMEKGIIYMAVENPITREELDAMGDVRQQTKTIHQWYLKHYDELKNKIEQYV